MHPQSYHHHASPQRTPLPKLCAVTGAAGFIGSRLLQLWDEAPGASFRALVRRSESVEMMKRLGRQAVAVDLLKPASVTSALAGCDAVVHLAHGDRGPEATSNLLRAMEACGIRRLVHISTMAVHGPEPNHSSQLEDTATISRYGNDYCDSKAEQEELVWARHRAGKLDLVVLRPTVVYGPGSAFVDLVVQEAKAGEVLLVDGGSGVCNAVFVDDVCRAIDCALLNNDLGQPYFINGDEAPSWRQFIEAFARLDDRSPRFSSIESSVAQAFWRTLNSAPRDGLMRRVWKKIASRVGGPPPRLPFPPLGRIHRETVHVVFSNAKARAELGWQPKTSFAEGVRLTAAGMRGSVDAN